MPQMSPMNWILLFIYFNFCFFVCVSKIYYLSLIQVAETSLTAKSFTNYNYNI